MIHGIPHYLVSTYFETFSLNCIIDNLILYIVNSSFLLNYGQIIWIDKFYLYKFGITICRLIAYKLDPTNTELLSQKQRLLADAVSATSDKLETLKKASEQAAKTKDNYDAWKAKYEPLKQKIGETETKLQNLKEQSRIADEQLSKGEISQEKYDALQREIKETTDELSSLKQFAKDSCQSESSILRFECGNRRYQCAGSRCCGDYRGSCGCIRESLENEWGFP